LSRKNDDESNNKMKRSQSLIKMNQSSQLMMTLNNEISNIEKKTELDEILSMAEAAISKANSIAEQKPLTNKSPIMNHFSQSRRKSTASTTTAASKNITKESVKINNLRKPINQMQRPLLHMKAPYRTNSTSKLIPNTKNQSITSTLPLRPPSNQNTNIDVIKLTKKVSLNEVEAQINNELETRAPFIDQLKNGQLKIPSDLEKTLNEHNDLKKKVSKEFNQKNRNDLSKNSFLNKLKENNFIKSETNTTKYYNKITKNGLKCLQTNVSLNLIEFDDNKIDLESNLIKFSIFKVKKI
jgi:hypothetical protein